MLILVIFFLGASLCFGHGTLDYSVGMPAYSQSYDNNYDLYHGYSFGITSRFKVAGIFGIGIHSNFIYFPEVLSGDSDEIILIRNEDCEVLFGFDYLFGPSFLLVDSSRFKIPLTLGVRSFGMVINIVEPYPCSTSKAEATFLDIGLGVGFSLGIEFFITKQLYLFGRAQGGLDLLYYSTSEIKTPKPCGSGFVTKTHSEHGFSRMFSINPQIGLGIQF